MDAMIFAAGLGTRLRPLTDRIPKALVEVGGVPMLEHVARRLVAAGATRLVVNVHHHAGQIRTFVRERDGFGVETLVSDETGLLLDTGGGLKKAGPLLRRDAPFIVHNVDVMSDIDLRSMLDAHAGADRLATLAVMERDSSRYLLFDDLGLCGHGGPTGENLARETTGDARRLGFTGIHVISPAIFDLMEEDGVFSIVPLYLRLSAGGRRIMPHRVDDARWMDIGSLERLRNADEFHRGEHQYQR